jgi:hypothetical protein
MEVFMNGLPRGGTERLCPIETTDSTVCPASPAVPELARRELLGFFQRDLHADCSAAGFSIGKANLIP